MKPLLALAALTFCLSAATARAQLLITVDIGNPGQTKVTATGTFPLAPAANLTEYDGFTLAGFFITPSNTLPLLSPLVSFTTLKPAATLSADLTANSLLYDTASTDDLSQPGVYADLSFYTNNPEDDPSDSVPQYFDPNQAAFTGTMTLDLSGVYVPFLPSLGATGDLYNGYSNSGGSGGNGGLIGTWRVVPEPSSYLLGLIAMAALGISLYRRSRTLLP